MRIVPSLPPPITVEEDKLAVKALTDVKPTKPVQAHTLSPLIVQQYARHDVPYNPSELQDRRNDAHDHKGRRIYCRRIDHYSFLVELRSKTDRRRQTQRAADATEHIDEEV